MNRLFSSLWASLTRSTATDAEMPPSQRQPQARRPLSRTAPSLMRLEARLVFDGAAVDTALHVVDATAGTADATARALEPAVNPVAPVIGADATAAAKGDDGKDTMVAATGAAESAALKEVAFVDTRVSGYQTLVSGLRADVEVVLIDSSRDGLAQMADWAATHSGYDAIHVLSHGAEGQLYLGRGELDSAALGDAQVRTELQQLGQALKADGDLLLYGCSVASGATGQAFLAQLADATGADVAASTNATGGAQLGGDWVLEARTGEVKADAPLDALGRAAYTNLLSTVTFVEGSSEDFDGGGSTSFTRSIGGATFTFTNGSSAFGASYFDIQQDVQTGLTGIYALSGRAGNSGVDFTISVAAGYTFDLTGFLAAASNDLDVYYNGMVSSQHFTINSSTTNTFSGISAFDDVTSITFTSVNYAIFQDLEIVDVKAVAASPTVTDGKISISGASGTGGAYKVGDTVTATWNNTAGGDNSSGVTGVTMDFSQFGGGSAVAASQSSGTWTATYTIVSGAIDATSRNVSVSATNGNGTTTTADSTNATVDNVAATVTDARISISGASGTGGAYKIGDTVTASWNNTAAGDNNADTISSVTADFSQFGGGSAVAATNSSGTWTATYTLVGGSINGTANRNVSFTARDNAGNATTTADTSNVTVDNVAATVSSVSVPANATYAAGQNLDFTVSFGDAVTVNTSGGTPRIALTVGSTTRYADYLSGSGTTALVFRHTVQAGDADANGIAVGSLSANGGTLRDASGNDATLTLNSVGSTASVLVDAVAPVFSSAATNTAGTTITLTYGDTLSASTASIGDFAVTADGQAVGVYSVAVSGSTVVLTLNGAVRAAQVVTVAYTDPTAGNDSGAVQDAAGNDAATLAATSVTNNTRATVTFDNAYQLFDNGTASGFAANTTGPDIDPNVGNAGINGVYITDLRFIASAASTAANGDFQLQGNDVTGTLEFTGTLTGSNGTPQTTSFSLLGALSKHIKGRNGNNNDSEAFYFWTAGNGSPWDGLGILMITKGSESWFTATETNLSMPADNAYLTTLNTYQSVQSDTLPPTLSSISLSDSALKAGETATVTFTFNEAVSGFTNADITVANGTLTNVSSADGGTTWTATFTPTTNLEDASNVISVDLTGVTDAASNAGTGTTSSGNYSIDTLRPTATITMADTALKAGETSLVTFTFSEAVSGFTNADLNIANGTLTSVGSVDGGITWTATFTPTANLEDATNLITLANTGVTDLAGNAGTGSTDSPNYAIDTQRPTASITMSDTALKIGDTALVTFTFTEAVTGFTNADLSIEGGTLTAVSTADGGLTWTATFTPSASTEDASNLITLDKTGVADGAGNAGSGTVSTGNYAVDTVRPTVTIAMADTALKAGETSLVTFTFSEAVSGFTNADLNIANGTLTSVSSGDGGITWTATFTPTANLEDASNLITLANTGVTDLAGNAGTGSTDSPNYAIDTQRPTASITMSDTALKIGDTALVTFTFTEAVTGFTNADLSIEGGTLTAVSTADGGLTWTATFTPSASTEDASNLITLDQTGVQDGAGNAGTGSVNTGNYTVDTLRPTASITMSDAALKIGDTALVTFTFTEAVTGFSNDDLSIEGGTLTAVSSGDGGITWTATFTPSASTEDASNLITLDRSGVSDGAGNAGTGSVSVANYAVDTLRPSATITLADTALKAGETTGVTFTFTEAVSGFSNADLSIDGGTLTAVSSVDGGITWTATFTPSASTEDASNLITLDQTGVADGAGNTGTGTVNTGNYTIDTLPPSNLASSVATLMRSDTGPGVVLGTLSATESSAVTWALATGNGSNDADNALFQIVGNQLRSTGTLPGGDLHFLLSATDAAGNVSTQAFTLTVIANTAGPSFTTPTPVAVQDTAEADRFAPFTGTLVATDSDGVAAYGLDGASAGSFSVGGQAYDLSRAGLYGTLYLDSTSGRYAYVADDGVVNARRTDISESFTVTATDGHASAPMSGSSTLTVNIAGANDRPALANPATVLYIDTPADDRFDTATTTLVGSDRDSGAVLSYGIVAGRAADDLAPRSVGRYGTLQVDRASGALVFTPDATAINALTADTSETFTLMVIDGELGSTATYTVELRAANDLPTLQPVPAIDYTDTAASDLFSASAGSLSAADRDAATVLSHGVQGGVVNAGTSRLAGRYGTLEVDTVTGAYRYTPDAAAINALDAAATDTFTLTVSDGTASATTGLTVRLAGVNDRPLIGSGATASVLENAGIDTVVYRATASDVDAGQTLRFRLSGADAALFDIDAVTGEVRLKAAADYEARASYRFEVVAYDDGTGALSASQAVTLQVLDVNEAPRITSPDEVHLAENGAAGARVATATARDADAGQRLRYSLSGEDAALFDIDADSGDLTIRAGADHEARASYRLLVTVTDNGQPALSDTQALTVWVDDVNEAPVLDAVAPVTVAEDLAVGSVVCSARASDVDAGQVLVYALTGPDAARFHIDARTGVVTLAQALDHETQPTLSFSIVVSDGGSPGLQAVREVTLKVTDVVEQLPVTAAPAPVDLRPPVLPPALEPAPAPAAPPVPPDDAAGRAVALLPPPRTVTAGFGVPVQTLSDGMAGAGLSVVRDIPMQRAAVNAGVPTVNFTIPSDTFSHTDPQASVSLQVSMVDGKPLPAWLKFDPATGSFSGQPPAGVAGVLDIRVVARDDQGRQVETQVRIQLDRAAAAAAGGQRQSEAGRPGLSKQWQGQGALAWKLDRDRLVQQARAVQAQRQGLADRPVQARAEAPLQGRPQRG